MLPKALWLRRHEREVYDCAERIVECTDWLMHRLTGKEPNLGWYDIHARHSTVG